jgi:exopolysaccharide biosynthesis polyprenyl glycosylphosphotransferase
MDKHERFANSGSPLEINEIPISSHSLDLESTRCNQHGLTVKFLVRILGSNVNTSLALCLLDVSALTLGFALAFGIRDSIVGYSGPFDYNFIPLFISYMITFFIILYLKSGYEPLMEKRPEDELAVLVKSMVFATLIFLTLSYILATITFSRLVFATGFTCSCVLLILFRFGLREILKRLWSYGLVQRNVIVVGDSIKSINQIMDHLYIQGYKGFNILGYLSDNLSLGDQNNGSTYLGKFEDLVKMHENTRIDKIIFAMRGYSFKRHQTLISRLNQCAEMNIPVMIPSEIFNNYDFSLTLNGYAGIFTVRRRKPAYSRPLYLIVKRLIDIFGSIVIMSISLPLWLMIIIAIKLHDRGPIFFHHRLVGKDRKIFYALKFRTMVPNAQGILRENQELFEQFKENYKLQNDPRITRVGKWLRKYSLDELPQFINILKGEMSIIGPRPVREAELDRFGEFSEERTKIRPGLTGFWQVNGRSKTTYAERIQMDQFYMVKCNLWMDLVIILKTPIEVIFGHGAM